MLVSSAKLNNLVVPPLLFVAPFPVNEVSPLMVKTAASMSATPSAPSKEIAPEGNERTTTMTLPLLLTSKWCYPATLVKAHPGVVHESVTLK